MKTKDRRHAGGLSSTLAFLCLTAVSGCLVDAGTGDTSVTTSALANETPDGTACYQDVPERKGSMSLGVCCFDDPIKGTSECVICDASHHCTVGGAEPGCLFGCGVAIGPAIGVSPSPVVTRPIAVPVTQSSQLAR
jgi:hypothetical protein